MSGNIDFIAMLNLGIGVHYWVQTTVILMVKSIQKAIEITLAVYRPPVQYSNEVITPLDIPEYQIIQSL
jgi:hypothetical protein